PVPLDLAHYFTNSLQDLRFTSSKLIRLNPSMSPRSSTRHIVATFARRAGATVALSVGIFTTCTFTTGAQETVPEEPLPSSTDYTAVQPDLAPPPLTPTPPLRGLDSPIVP